MTFLLEERKVSLMFVVMTTVFAIWLSVSNAANRLDLILYDYVMPWAVGPVGEKKITVIEIDEQSLVALGPWPWLRGVHADLLAVITPLEPEKIAYDVIFAEEKVDDLEGDAYLAEIANRYGRLVLPLFYDQLRVGTEPSQIGPYPSLRDAVDSYGHVEIIADSDGIVRRIYETSRTSPDVLPSLAKALVSPNPQQEDPVEQARTMKAQGDINYVPFGFEEPFDRLSFGDVVSGNFNPELITGRYIIIGPSASGISSTFATPLDANMPGIRLHAYNANMLLSATRWQDVDPVIRVVFVVFSGFWLSLIMALQKSNLPVGFFSSLAILLLSYIALRWYNVWIRPVDFLIVANLASVVWGVALRQQDRVRHEASRRQAQITLEAITDAVLTVDLYGKITYANRAACDLTGNDAGQLLGRPLEEKVILLNTDDWRKARIKRSQSRLMRAVNEIREIEVSIEELHASEEIEVRQVVVIHDVTDQTLMNKALAASEKRRLDAERQLQSAERIMAVAEVSASIAHEINQPLAAVSTYASTAARLSEQRPVDTEAVQSVMDKIKKQTDRAGKVIRHLRDCFELDRIEADTCHINDVVQDAIDASALTSTYRHVQIDLKLASDLPIIRLDQVQVQQLIINLMKNAIEATVNQRLRQVKVETTQRPGYVIVAVHDNGPGIDPQMQNRLFDSFQTSKNGGMGIGLAICRRVSEAHGGRLEVTSNPDKGSTISFWIPTRIKE